MFVVVVVATPPTPPAPAVLAPNGDVVVVWWRDLAKDALVYRKHTFATGEWGVERVAGLASESNSHPQVVFAGNRSWVAYQIQNSKNSCVGAQIIDDDVEPFRSIVATSTFPGDLDVKLVAEATHLWVTWIDNGWNVGYSEYSFERQRWSVPAYEPYGVDSTAAARQRIRSRLLVP